MRLRATPRHTLCCPTAQLRRCDTCATEKRQLHAYDCPTRLQRALATMLGCCMTIFCMCQNALPPLLQNAADNPSQRCSSPEAHPCRLCLRLVRASCVPNRPLRLSGTDPGDCESGPARALCAHRSRSRNNCTQPNFCEDPDSVCQSDSVPAGGGVQLGRSPINVCSSFADGLRRRSGMTCAVTLDQCQSA